MDQKRSLVIESLERQIERRVLKIDRVFKVLNERHKEKKKIQNELKRVSFIHRKTLIEESSSSSD